MKHQKLKSLSDIYSHETEFSEDLASNLSVLGFGEFQDIKCEVPTAKRSADIVASRDNDVLVVENQFDSGDWDHWGRLEGYARFHRATIAVLVAEGFEELMRETCMQRNVEAESDIRWYLISAKVNSHDEFSFERVVEPGAGIPSVGSESGYSEFWAPIRQDKNCLFSGKPVSNRNDGYVRKGVHGIGVFLILRDSWCVVELAFEGERRAERREEVMELFSELEYPYKYKESRKFVFATFERIDGGRKTPDRWNEARKKLVDMGSQIYNRINKSGL